MIIFYSVKIEGNTIILQGEEHLHCTKVLRYRIGKMISITDGHGNVYQAEIVKIGKSESSCLIVKKTITPKPHQLPSIGISILKNPARIEWFVEKAVEIGISEIFLFSASRTEKKTINKERLEKIIIASMKQSLNLYLPRLTIVKNFDDLILKATPFDGKFLAWCGGDTKHLQDVRHTNKNNILLIGPEGDFATDEIKTALDHGFKLVSLGKTRLRTETAGIVGLTLLHY